MMVSWKAFDRLWDGRRDPFGRALDELFPVFNRTGDPASATEVEETSEAFLFRVDLPGVTRDDLTVSFSDGVLTVRAERRHEVPEGYALTRRERSRAAFERRLRFRTPLAAAEASARFDDGVLTITLPKAEDAKPHTITVL